MDWNLVVGFLVLVITLPQAVHALIELRARRRR